MLKKTISWGIIGVGNVCERKSAPAYQKTDGFALKTVMRRDLDKARDFALRHGVENYCDDAEQLINDPTIQAVYIATPPDSHLSYALKVAEAGKICCVEKPMALNFAECQQMIKASEETKVPLYVAYYRRALPSFLKVKELIESGVIGTVRFVHIELYKALTINAGEEKPWRVDPKVAGAGNFFDLASHQLDYLDFLFGPVTEVVSIALNQAGNYDAEDMVSASFLMPGNIVVNGNWNFTVPKFLEKDTIEIIGTKGKIKFSCFDFVPVELITEHAKQAFEFPKPKHVQQNMIQLVVDDLLGRGKSPSTGLTGARTNWVMGEVVKKYYKME